MSCNYPKQIDASLHIVYVVFGFEFDKIRELDFYIVKTKRKKKKSGEIEYK